MHASGSLFLAQWPSRQLMDPTAARFTKRMRVLIQLLLGQKQVRPRITRLLKAHVVLLIELIPAGPGKGAVYSSGEQSKDSAACESNAAISATFKAQRTYIYYIAHSTDTKRTARRWPRNEAYTRITLPCGRGHANGVCLSLTLRLQPPSAAPSCVYC